MLDNDFDNEEYTDDFDELDISDSDQIAREIDRIEQDSLEAKHKKEKDKNYYVTNKELLAEIRKYCESKKKDPEGRRTYIWRTWNDDNENMYKIFITS